MDQRIWRSLKRASQSVASSEGRVELGDIPARNDASALESLCSAIHAAARGESLSSRDLPDATAEELLPSLRRAFLEELAHAGDTLRPLEVVHALRAVEAVGAALEKRRTRVDASLTEDDGCSLVVEVAHDMRSPLAAILFLVETISRERSGPLHPSQQRQLGLVYSAAFALSTLTNDLIEFARGGGSLLDGQPSPFSIAGLLCGVRDIILPIAEEKGLSVVLTPPESDWRVGYAAALHRVLLNLSTNALKFTDEGRVEVTARQLTRTTVEFSVADTGRGLPSNIVKAISEPEPPVGQLGSRGFCSSGLGLSICRKLVAGMGGELKAETTPGLGSRLYFTVDLALSPKL